MVKNKSNKKRKQVMTEQVQQNDQTVEIQQLQQQINILNGEKAVLSRLNEIIESDLKTYKNNVAILSLQQEELQQTIKALQSQIESKNESAQ